MVPRTATEDLFISQPELTMSFMRNICTQTDVANARTHIPWYTLDLMATGFHCCHHIKNTDVTTPPEQSGAPGSHFSRAQMRRPTTRTRQQRWKLAG